jgi:hypothetical protein
MRADLSLRAVRRIATFVSSALVRLLSERSGLDEETATYLSKRVRERIEHEQVHEDPAAMNAKVQATVEEALAHGKLDDEFVMRAAEAGDRRMVAFALATLAGVPKAVIDRVLVSQSGKAITALVWRAKLPMRVSVKIQGSVAHLRGDKLVAAREGIHFPLSEDEMTWHLGYFGING